MSFRKAERKRAKLRLAITGPAGSGKTYSALLIAFGLGGKIAMIDTENGSGDLYADLGDYDVCTLSAPYSIEKYLAAIREAENAGYDIIIIDSLSHAWSGEGGLLDLQGKIAASSKSGNSYAAWRQVTPMHNKLIEAMLTSRCHIIATMRSKTEYVQAENERGRTEIRKVGLAPVQREGMDYEFGTVFDLGVDHNATVSKDRTGIFDGKIFTISMITGQTLKEWLEKGIEVSPVARPEARQEIYKAYLDHFNGDTMQAQQKILEMTDGRGSREWTEDDVTNLRTQLSVLETITLTQPEDFVPAI